MRRKERVGQRVKDGEESICFMLGRKVQQGKDDEESTARKGRKGRRRKDGKDGEERTARKEMKGRRGKDGEERNERTAR